MTKVNCKLDEFVAALEQAMTFRFAHKYGEKLIPILEELVKVGGPNKSDAAKIASLQSILDALKLPAAFNPLAKTQLAKVLGEARLPYVEGIMGDNVAFYATLKSSLPLVVQLLENPRELGPSQLMNEHLVPWFERIGLIDVYDRLKIQFNDSYTNFRLYLKN